MTIPVIALIGATGTGKTALAIQLAEAFGGEIVNADSRQVYRHMDIGTAKPSAADRAQIQAPAPIAIGGLVSRMSAARKS